MPRTASALAAILFAGSLAACSSAGPSASPMPAADLIPKIIHGAALTFRTATPGWTEPLLPDSGPVRIAALLGLTREDIYSAGGAADRPNESPATTPSTIDLVWTSFRGARPDKILKAWISWASAACPACTVTEVLIRGKNAATSTAAGASSPGVYAYASGDTLYEIVAHEPAVAEEAISQLP